MIKIALKTLINKLPHSVFKTALGEYVPVFMLHRVKSDITPDGHDLTMVKRCLEYVRNENYTPISLENLISAHLNVQKIPPKSIVFTVDDGFRDNIVDLGDLFGSFDIPLNCFVITDFIEKKIWPWDDQVKYGLSKSKSTKCTIRLPDGKVLNLDSDSGNLTECKTVLRDQLKVQSQENIYQWFQSEFFPAIGVNFPESIPEYFEPASWEEINSFIAAGHSVAPHTATHRILSSISDTEAKLEIEASFDTLRKRVKQVCPIFAYPTGRESDFSDVHKKMCKELGLTAAVSTTPNYWRRDSDLYSIPRFSMPNNFENFIEYVGAIEAIKQKMKWLKSGH